MASISEERGAIYRYEQFYHLLSKFAVTASYSTSDVAV